ncbi:phosphotransferase family protein [Cryptosporangium minutisporangium]|uniref:Phosphotransferase family protein n=1 Tax=Cryptosporangium minutisporangium TaxID=113569 RepID=A0ABP6STT9_9ACTN
MAPESSLPGLDLDALAAWASVHLPEQGTVQSATLISGGLSNLTFRVVFEASSLILRRPPRGPVLPSAHDMGREYRVLSGLQQSAVPVARTAAFEPGPDVLGAPFYLVEDVVGEVYRRPEQTAALAPDDRGAIGASVVEALARIHEVDLVETGLSEFGPPTGYLQRQVRRWGRQWAASKTRDLPVMEELLTRLGTDLPTDSETTLVHGDYRLDNMIIRGTDVAAVVDWELSTLGDPLADLALTLLYWADDGSVSSAGGVTGHPGFPTADEFAAAYATRTGRELDLLPLYRAFAEFKLAVILEGVHARYLAGGTVGDGYAAAGRAVPMLAERALAGLLDR